LSIEAKELFKVFNKLKVDPNNKILQLRYIQQFPSNTKHFKNLFDPEDFSDRIIKCSKCKSVFRADKVIEENYEVAADAFSDKKILDFINEKGIKCF